jgi:Sel1 repeat
MSGAEGKALAEGFYWYAEKLMWGYEDTPKNPQEALRFYKQAAALEWSDAHIRIGQLHEYGKGTSQDAAAALASYQKAAAAGNFFAHAFIAKLLSRTPHAEKADLFWQRFFLALEDEPEPPFLADTPGGHIHAYLTAQLRRGRAPEHLDVIRQHRNEIIAHHQQLLEHAHSPEQLDRLDVVADWLKANFT